MERMARGLMDRSFTAAGLFSIVLLASVLVILIVPIAWGGMKAFIFQGTIEHRRMLLEQFRRGSEKKVLSEMAEAMAARKQAYDMLAAFERELADMDLAARRKYEAPLDDLKNNLRALLGPLPTDPSPVLMRDQYGQTRWDQATIHLKQVLFVEQYDYSDPTQMGRLILVPRANDFKGTKMEPFFALVKDNAWQMLMPKWTFYWRFLFDRSHDSHFFGGIWSEMLGTIYLTIGAILFAVPMGVISAIYLVEYASPDTRIVRFIRTCISTLAGVPSIVFGLFGLAFFINTLHVSHSKSVLAGALTLAILILPLIIRSAEEAIRAVPSTFREASLSLGAGKWRTVVTVVLPVAMPGILTGVVISMGRAAGETAPIIFTAAVSVGQPLPL